MEPEQPRPATPAGWLAGVDAIDYRTMLESAPAYFYLAAADSRTLYRSPQAEPMLGYSLAEWDADPNLWNSIIHPEDRERVETEFGVAAKGGEPFHSEYRLRTKDGRYLWVRDHAARTTLPDGSQGLQGVVLDIDEEVVARRTAQEELARTLTLLESAQQVGKVGTFVTWFGRGERHDLWSRSCLEMLGYPPDTEPTGELFWERIHPDDKERVRAERERVEAEGDLFESEFRIVLPDGQERWIRDRARVERASDGSLARFTGVLIDVTDEHNLEAAAQEAEKARSATTRFYDGVFERAPLGVAKVDVHIRVQEANQRLHEMLMVEPGRMTGRSVAEFLEPEGMAQLMSEFRPLWLGRVERIESAANAVRSDGQKIWLQWNATAVRSLSGRVEYFLAMFEDVTARRAAEDAARDSLAALERLNVLKSEFVSIVSHEFRTALTGIQGFSEIIRDEDLSRQEIREFASDINNDALRLNRMITEMLDLDRMEAGRMTLSTSELDLGAIIRDAVERTAATAEKHQLVAEVEPDLPPIRADGDRVLQVIANLLSNAVKYSPQGGEVKVATGHDAETVTVRVTDHGLGMPASFMTKVFDRYERYASSATDNILGTGLGLPISKQIVEMHGGKIGVDSVEGQGSTFWFTLPIAGPPPPSEPAVLPAVVR